MYNDLALKPGDIVVAIMPFTSLEGAKPRPALVLGIPDGCNVTLAVITSKRHNDRYTVEVSPSSFYYNPHIVKKPYSEIRASQIFTISRSVISKKIGMIPKQTLSIVKTKIKLMLDL